jgi:tyrosine ammonia-lyase
LQQNLIFHLSTGVGVAFPWVTSRAIVLARAMALVQGVSGARPETIGRLIAILNSDLAPEVPERGTVGASGDLTPLAHLALCLQGHGSFLARDGVRIPAVDALERLHLAPLDLSHRDGLALVNGTSAMTGVAILNAQRLEHALEWSVTLSGAMAEALGGRSEAWDPLFAELRPHPGQKRATERLNSVTRGSDRLDRVPLAQHRLGTEIDVSDLGRSGQDAYTLRCAPQVIGAVWDAADWHRRIVETELHSVTDNPIFPENTKVAALHGGNFMGGHVALASDAAAISATVLAGFHERQIARITDEKLNGDLPAFLSGGTIGLHSGLMGAQVTATALIAEMRCLGPASVHSISTNGANQDVVSQGTIAARLLRDKLDHLSRIQAILAIAVVQAIDIADRNGMTSRLSRSAHALHAFVRETSAFLGADRSLGREIDELAQRLEDDGPELCKE